MSDELCEQHDNHIWLVVHGGSWAIRKMRWPIIWLWRGYEPDLEYYSVLMGEFNEEAYIAKAVAMLEEQ